MTQYLALLGSINVGGNRIAMADLKAALAHAGFAKVSTIAASGNVLFDSDGEEADILETRIADLVASEFAIETFAVVRTGEELVRARDECPFAGQGADKLVHIMFLERQPSAARFAQLQSDHAGRGPEKLAPGDRALHIDYVDGVGSTRLTKQFIERRLGCRGTARNISSLGKLIEKFDR
ncbi:MAG: DUF1697 domain-containing protein [Sphingomonadaceae bacterium]|nr:DUF1697 domain-containing protein [Sphingomonadaceae bacterium]MCP5383266.1 DUF1697 domain-containing protein [Altererythrobacter sp.]MCP5393443.1 DUF1697 domain-containing protein [Sphingomonadaceae bacterium]